MAVEGKNFDLAKTTGTMDPFLCAPCEPQAPQTEHQERFRPSMAGSGTFNWLAKRVRRAMDSEDERC